MKMCGDCKKMKSLDSFYFKPGGRLRTGRLIPYSYCKVCNGIRGKKWASDNYQKRRKHILDWHRKKKYGVGQDVYEKMVSIQCGKCAICNNEAKLFMDHCHATGKIRDLLCTRCNSAIGFARDRIDLLCSMVGYLKRHGK